MLHVLTPAAGPLAAIELLVEKGVRGELEVRMGFCCMGMAHGGAELCTCWDPVYDVEQALVLDAIAPLETRTTCCDDCAYRNGSPERSGDEEEWLLDLPARASTRFYCHEGMRRVMSYRHPSGLILPAGRGDYAPPREGDRAYRADGTPALVCAGFAAHRKALLA